MSTLVLMLALQLTSGPVICDSALLAKPVRTPFSTPPVIVDRLGTLAAIEREARSVSGVPDGASVLIWFLIDTGGKIAAAQLDQSAGQGIAESPADSAALKVARTFRFQPAQLNGKPVCVWIRFPVRIPPRDARSRDGRPPWV